MGKHGEGTLLNRNGVWVHKSRINGKDTRRSTGCTNRKDAEAWVKTNITPITTASTAKEATERARQIKIKASPINFTEALRVFFAAPRKRSPAAKRRTGIESQWGDFAAWATDQGLTQISQVSPEQGAAYLAHLREFGRYNESRPGMTARPTSADTANTYHITLKAIFAAAMKPAGITENPFAFNKAKKDTLDREAFTLDELRDILQASESLPILRQLITVLLLTGMRTVDACKLTWAEVDQRAGILRRKTSKTGSKIEIPIHPELLRLIQSQPQGARGEPVFTELFDQYERNPIKLSNHFSKLLDSLGIEHSQAVSGRSRPHVFKDLHSFRHTAIFMLQEKGATLAELMSIAGHATQAVALKYAAHASRENKARLINSLPDFFSSAPEEKKKAANEVIEAEIVPPAEVKAKEAAAMLRKALKSTDPDKVKELVKQALKTLES